MAAMAELYKQGACQWLPKNGTTEGQQACGGPAARSWLQHGTTV